MVTQSGGIPVELNTGVMLYTEVRKDCATVFRKAPGGQPQPLITVWPDAARYTPGFDHVKTADSMLKQYAATERLMAIKKGNVNGKG